MHDKPVSFDARRYYKVPRGSMWALAAFMCRKPMLGRRSSTGRRSGRRAFRCLTENFPFPLSLGRVFQLPTLCSLQALFRDTGQNSALRRSVDSATCGAEAIFGAQKCLQRLASQHSQHFRAARRPPNRILRIAARPPPLAGLRILRIAPRSSQAYESYESRPAARRPTHHESPPARARDRPPLLAVAS